MFMSNNTSNGNFWFSDFESYQFQGILKDDKEIELKMIGGQTFDYKDLQEQQEFLLPHQRIF